MILSIIMLLIFALLMCIITFMFLIFANFVLDNFHEKRNRKKEDKLNVRK